MKRPVSMDKRKDVFKVPPAALVRELNRLSDALAPGNRIRRDTLKQIAVDMERYN